MKNVLLIVSWFVIVVTGMITVNINHHINLPQEALSKDIILTKHFWNTRFPYIHTETDIEFRQEIQDYESVRRVNIALQEAYKGDVIVFHLAGIGGQVNTVYDLVNNIKNSKAKVIMSVEAPVYSGHAYLALSGNELRMAKNTYLMLHTTSEIDLDCSKSEGLDRGVSNTEHCQAMKDADMILFYQYLLSLPYLTSEQLIKLKTGHDVYIFPNQV